MGKLPKKFEHRLLERLKKEASYQADLPPQNLGRFTYAFKDMSVFLKYSPLRVFILFSILLSLVALFLLGGGLVKLTSILQRGF